MKAGHLGQKRADRGGASAVRDFGQLALWMAASLAGLVTAVLIARGPYFRRMSRSVGIRPTTRRRRRSVGRGRPTREESLPMLAEAIVGNSRGAVASVFGPPRNAVVPGTFVDGAMPTRETWYYPMRQEQNLAMAIEFIDDSARHVEFFSAPAVAA